MKTIEIQLFKFSELSEKAKQKAVKKCYDINVSHGWWESVYEDAANVGIKINGFDLDRSRGASGIINDCLRTAELIIENHGEHCDTYKTAETFLSDWANLVIKHSDGKDFTKVAEGNEYDFDNEADELENEFTANILEDYSIMLQNEYEYLMSEAAIIETIEANDYDFTEDGKLY